MVINEGPNERELNEKASNLSEAKDNGRMLDLQTKSHVLKN